jgi:16S rRNA (cytosine1402-N4)-methyltransferase
MNLFNTDDQLKHYKQNISKSWIPLNKKVIIPSDQEIESNPRARSAKLRIAEKV